MNRDKHISPNIDDIIKKWKPILDNIQPMTDEMRQKIKEGKIKTIPVNL